MDLPSSIDQWIKETEDLLAQLKAEIKKGLDARHAIYEIRVPADFPRGMRTDLDNVAESIDKAIEQMTVIESKLEGRLKRLRQERASATSQEGA